MIDGKITIRRAWRSQIPKLVIYFALCVASIILSRKFPGTIIHGKLFSIGSITIWLRFPLFTLLPLWGLLNVIYPIYDALFTIDGNGVEMRKGILSLRQNIIRVRYEDIRVIEVQQTLLERILNIGAVEVGSAATGKIEIVFDRISSPHELQRAIQAEKDARLKRARQKSSAAMTAAR
ncbi:MAG: PH domain-containing protein [Candidatus Dadabacteria bacterium]|nr:MAG: PH domain-containing protein [Candidatus Dadabacteria bacterium]